MSSRSLFNRVATLSKLIVIGSVLFVTPLYTTTAFALDVTLGYGVYDPQEGIVRDLFESSLVNSLKLNWRYYDTFDWFTSYSNQTMKSRVSSLETYIKLEMLHLGFEKRLTEAGATHAINPFIGAGISMVRITEEVEDESTETKTDPETSTVTGSFWEIGLLGQVFAQTWIELRLSEQRVSQNVLGNVHIGGRFLFLGLRVGF